MSFLKPFRALRPLPSLAPLVASVPYDVVSTEEARALAEGNPWSFLRVSRAEITHPAGIDPYAPEVYASAADQFSHLRANAMLREHEPSLYLYRLRMGDHEQTGIAGCFSLAEYETGVILRHELTRRDKEDDRTRHMHELRAQTGPVLLAYRGHEEVDAIVAAGIRTEPLYDFTSPDGIGHTIWRVPDRVAAELVAAFASIPRLYIADGHHRAASAARNRAMLLPHGGGEHDSFLAVAFPDTQLRILPYNRLIKDLHGRSPGQLLHALHETLHLEDGGPTPTARHDVSMYLAGAWHRLRFENVPEDDPIGALDAALLSDRVLGPLLGILDLRSDARMDFMGGSRGTRVLEARVDSDEAAAAFSMFPVSLNELFRVADAGDVMPPKSTWFEPKLRDGLLSHLF